MDVAKYLAVLVVLCLEGGETGGGGGKHHDHVRIHIPEFIHHDHHKKVITIHHHHHKPKKETHHHHHHHQKPHIPYGHHYHHHHKKVATKTHTEKKGGKHGHHHAKHGHHGNHGHHGHQGHHGHHGHGHGHHHDAPVVPNFSYSPTSVPSYEDDYSPSYSPSVPAYGGGYGSTGFSSPQSPRVHGVTHTVKQVKVFDTLPGALPKGIGTGNGYEVTEEGEGDEDDVFTTVNQLQNRFPATFGYVRSAAPEPTNDPYSELTSQGALPTQFASAPVPTTALSGGIESFSTAQSDPFASSAPTQSIGLGLPSVQPSVDYPVTFQGDGFEGQLNSFTGSDGKDGSYLSNEENTLNDDDTPVSFTREAGIQHTTNTGNVETLVY